MQVGPPFYSAGMACLTDCKGNAATDCPAQTIYSVNTGARTRVAAEQLLPSSRFLTTCLMCLGPYVQNEGRDAACMLVSLEWSAEKQVRTVRQSVPYTSNGVP